MLNVEKIKKVGIWIRVSTEDQARGESPLHHEKRARYYAEAKEWQVVELYNLSGVSGKTIMDHPEAKRMIDDIKKGHISALIFSKLARLARNTRELLDIADIFRDCQAGLISLQESIDTTSPAGRLFYTMIAAMAQWEREEISERVAASVPIRAKLGKPTGGVAPFGFKWEKNELIIDSKEAPIRKLMFELFLKHRRKKTVARLLNEMGHRTRKGKNFSDTTVDRLLTDPVAKGLRRANYTRSLGEGKKWELKPEEEWVYSQVEPIVAEELWSQCNDILSTQKASNKKIARKPAIHLFTGLIYCECGGKMYVPSNNPKYTCQKCKKKIRVDDLEAIYQIELKEFLLSEDDLHAYLHQSDDVLVEKIEQLQLLEKKEKEIQTEINKLYDLYIEDQISKEGFGRKYTPLEERLNQLENQIPKLQSEIDLLKIKSISSEEILTEAKDLNSRWSTLSRDEQRQIVETITDTITIRDDEIDINFHYLPLFLNSDNMATHEWTCVAMLQPVVKSIKRKIKSAYPKKLKTLGDHIRKRRLDLKLEQQQVAKILKITESTVWNWEKNRVNPRTKYYPYIMEFLGYCPYESAKTWGDKLKLHRVYQGLSYRKLGERLRIDPGTLERWEKGGKIPWKRLKDRVDGFMGVGNF